MESVFEINYEDIPAYFWFTAAFVVIIFAYALEVFRRRAVTRENGPNEYDNAANSSDFTRKTAKEDRRYDENVYNRNSGPNLIECNSPNCIRCSKNLHIIQRAQQRLATYYAPSSDHDFVNSIDHLRQDLLESQSQNSDQLSTKNKAVKLTASTPTLFFLRGLREQECFSIDEFPGLDNLEDKWDQIHLEFQHLYLSPLPETKLMWKVNVTDSGKWEISHLINQGKITKAGELCPLTMSLLNRFPSLMKENLFGNAAFSVVHPQTDIAKHCGSTNFRIRCHLGLRMPRSGTVCQLDVNGTMHDWKEGEAICFNDAFPHAVHHQGVIDSGVRVVLLLDLWHPDTSKSMRQLLDYVFSPSD